MNAHTCKDDCKGTPYHEITNRNGQLLLDISSQCDLINLTITYTKRSSKLWNANIQMDRKAH